MNPYYNGQTYAEMQPDVLYYPGNTQFKIADYMWKCKQSGTLYLGQATISKNHPKSIKTWIEFFKDRNIWNDEKKSIDLGLKQTNDTVNQNKKTETKSKPKTSIYPETSNKTSIYPVTFLYFTLAENEAEFSESKTKSVIFAGVKDPQVDNLIKYIHFRSCIVNLHSKLEKPVATSDTTLNHEPKIEPKT